MIDPHAKLVAAVREQAGDAVEMLRTSSRPWASATFSGARHRLRLALPRAAADDLAAGLEEYEFTIRGHLIADLTIVSRQDTGALVTLDIEVLTIEDR